MKLKSKSKSIVLLSTDDNEIIQLKCKYDRKMLLNRSSTLMDFIINISTVEENEIFVKSHDNVCKALIEMN
jgi:CMP-N-acetylneuraminic acid synthetase